MREGPQGPAGAERQPRISHLNTGTERPSPAGGFFTAQIYPSTCIDVCLRCVSSTPWDCVASGVAEVAKQKALLRGGLQEFQPGPESPAAHDHGTETERFAAAGKMHTEHHLGACGQFAGQYQPRAAARQVERPPMYHHFHSAPVHLRPHHETRTHVDRTPVVAEAGIERTAGD